MKTVLIADFNAKSLDELSSVLHRYDFQILRASTGEAALKAYEEHKPDLAILATLLPKVNGLEVCRQITSGQLGRHSPVILFSGIYKGEKYRSQAVEHYGAAAYFEKPMDYDALTKKIHELLHIESDATSHAFSAPSPSSARSHRAAPPVAPHASGSIEDDIAMQQLQALLVDAQARVEQKKKDMDARAAAIFDNKNVMDELDELLKALEEVAQEDSPFSTSRTASEPEVKLIPIRPGAPETPLASVAVEERVATESGLSAEPIAESSTEVTASKMPPVEVPPTSVEAWAPAPSVAKTASEPGRVVPLAEEVAVDQELPAARSVGASITAPSESVFFSAKLMVAAAVIIVGLAVGGYMFLRSGSKNSSQEKSAVAANSTAETIVTTTPSTLATNDAVPLGGISTTQPNGAASAPSTAPAQNSAHPSSGKNGATQASSTPTSPTESSAPEPNKQNASVNSSAPPTTEPTQAVPHSGTGTVPAPSLAFNVVTPPPPTFTFSAPTITPPSATRASVKEGDLVALTPDVQAPKILKRVDPPIPPAAKALRRNGSVQLSVLVDENGNVSDARILDGDKQLGFGDAVLSVIHKWKFSPAIKEGKRVKVYINLAVNFKVTS